MDFLIFKTFLSIEALIVFYYIGAVIFPVGIWILMLWLLKRYDFINEAYLQGKELVWKSINRSQRIKLAITFIIIFMFMELFWRMLFEFLIAYMQIRDALIKLPM